MEKLQKLLACCRDAMVADGFVVFCDDSQEGERFRIAARDQSMVLELLFHDIEVTRPHSEAALRTKLTRIGLSTEAIDAKIQLARAFDEAKSRYMGLPIRVNRPTP